MSASVCRIAVFYDGTYFNKVSNYYLYQHERRARLSLKGIHDFVCAEVARLEGAHLSRCQVVDASYFRARLTAPMAQERDRLYGERMFEDMLVRADVNLYQQHVTVLADGSFEERRVDVWMALEAYEAAVLKRYDVVVLLTGDGDFVPLVRKLTGLGTRVMLLGWDFSFEREGKLHRTQVSHALLERATYPVMMGEVIEQRRDEALINGLFFARAPEFSPRPAAPQAALTAAPAPTPEELDADERPGVLANWFADKGYGFIRPTLGGDNLFFHVSELVEGDALDLQPQSAVSYHMVQGDRGPVAKQVRLLRA
ncbi:NYN domain-containing protein [Inhella gelatinilytica]|uniref:NYN domain-containing protein n=1 Tax=Inhella gelatinilytica TaxID=2795030 RepID=A0A931IUD0_9BURK|nr:NYN domain-containing protein [Inhella gelatinilytica]MBH9552117.1 NYN domain-containing protein [Inhella gelatinilytica]